MNKGLLLTFTFLINFNCLAFQQGNFSAFVYHRFGDDRFPSTNISLSNFESHLKFLKENNYEVQPLSETLSRLNSKKKRMPNAAVITIDDAYKSFYENGWPLLKKYGFKATLYVNTKTVGAPDYMTWDEIKEVAASGIEIGNHSHGHNYFLNGRTIQLFIDDLKESHLSFQKHLNSVPDTYAYPYGEWNEEMAYVLDTIGYKSAAAQNSGVVHTNSERFSLPRFPMPDAYADLDQFKQKLQVSAIEVTESKMISSGYLGSMSRPRLKVWFKEKHFRLDQLQCFIQGSPAQKSITVERNDLVELSVWPKNKLNKRRTLFTITVPDVNGIWHWYSYSWVIPSIEN